MRRDKIIVKIELLSTSIAKLTKLFTLSHVTFADKKIRILNDFIKLTADRSAADGESMRLRHKDEL